jgi:collagen type VI alpha
LFFSILPACDAKVDLGFLIDGSASLEMYGTGTFQKCLDFIKTVVDSFDVAKEGTRVGAITFSDNSTVDFNFGTYNDKDKLDDAIDKISNPGLTTFTGKALKLAMDKLFISARKGVPKILVVMTDGRSHDDVVKPSQVLKRAGIQIVTVGLGKNYDLAQLKVIASKPVTKHLITVDFPQLSDASKILQDLICKGMFNNSHTTSISILDWRKYDKWC